MGGSSRGEQYAKHDTVEGLARNLGRLWDKKKSRICAGVDCASTFQSSGYEVSAFSSMCSMTSAIMNHGGALEPASSFCFDDSGGPES